MGSFSWRKADTLGKVGNIVSGAPFKFLIPKEFGGGFIQEKYQDYGDMGPSSENGIPRYDMYELLAFWNRDIAEAAGYTLMFDGDVPPLMAETGEYTDHNRVVGINIACYRDQIDALRFPLKLVSASYKGTYEDCEGRSYGDPHQGFYPYSRTRFESRDREIAYRITYELCEANVDMKKISAKTQEKLLGFSDGFWCHWDDERKNCEIQQFRNFALLFGGTPEEQLEAYFGGENNV